MLTSYIVTVFGPKGSISVLVDIKVHGSRPVQGSTAKTLESQDFPQLTGGYSDITGQDIEYWE